ncbi:APC family permease [Pseudonocardia spinosispora]|uniref:APC family permease n=1 Tax=Pseudonocardia spinosispora TaxID=103441 RepID=UPI0003FC39C3|nr:APC family permease [Pseudonocardia spinosispora]
MSATERGLRKDVRLVGLLFTSVGAIIGSGWLFGAQSAANTAGPAAVLSWVIGGVMIMAIAFVYAELGTMFPVSGGTARFPHYAFGSFTSYGFGWILWITCASASAIEVEAALQYSAARFDSLMHEVDGVPVLTWPFGFAVAVALLAVLTALNLYGVKWFARANNVLVWWKLGVIVVVIVAFLATAFHAGNFDLPDAAAGGEGGFAPFGVEGVLTSIATSGVVFSYLGFRQGIELAGETDRPRRNIPVAVIGSVLVTGALYILLQVAFTAALPPEALAGGWSHIALTSGQATAFGPLAALATILGLHWLAATLYLDAVVSPADSGLIYLTSTSRVTYAMGRNRNAPPSLATLDRRGTPWVSLLLAFVAGVIFFLPFPGWQSLVGFVTAATVLSLGSGALAVGALRRSLPDHPRVFRLPGRDTVPFLAFYSSNLIVFWTGWHTDWKLFVAVLLGYLIFAATRPFLPGGPPLELRAASWFFPWLGGLALISYLGEFPDPADGAGNTGAIGLGWGFAVVALWSAVIYAWAMRVRLSDDKVARLVDSGFVGEDEPAITTTEVNR